MNLITPDVAKTDPNDDALGYAPFARHLARAIGNYPLGEGVVIALHGPWGSGKTTVLNYVKHYLEVERGEGRPLVVDFNPWWFSGHEDLALIFLAQLMTKVSSAGKSFEEVRENLGTFLKGLGCLADLVGYGAGAGRESGEKLAELVEGRNLDVPAFKMKVADALKESQKRVLVVVDDIDRLRPSEVRQVFTVIKALADFPNVVYLLAFDRDAAAKAVTADTGLLGEDFLEKIVQVPFTLPPPEPGALEELLVAKLNVILGDLSQEEFDSDRWNRLMDEGLREMIKVPRDVVRFTNTLPVTYQAVRGEVNPVDFIGMEALRVFKPKVYEYILENENLMTGDRALSDKQGENEERIKHFTDATGETWDKKCCSAGLGVAKELFLRMPFARFTGLGYHGDWKRELRVCDPEHFHTYFRLSVPAGLVGSEELSSLLGSIGTPGELTRILLKATEEKPTKFGSKAERLVRRLDLFRDKITIAEIPSVFNELLDVGDDLSRLTNPNPILGYGIVGPICDLLRNLTMRVQVEERHHPIAKAIEHGRAVYTQGYLLAVFEDHYKPGNGSDTFVVPREGFDELTGTWVQKLHKQGSELARHPNLPFLINYWVKWGEIGDVRKWAEEVMKDEGLLLEFLDKMALVKGPQGRSIDAEWLSKFIDLSVLKGKVSELLEKGPVDEKYREAVALLQREFRMIEHFTRETP